jgi:formate hydrogenlyase subunit 6/NADH:ubiquinone oxidoreductase subunit I
MLTADQFDERVKDLYRYQRDRLKRFQKKKRWKWFRPTELSFTLDDFALKVWKTVGLFAIPCRFCSRPVDVLEISPDHHHPLKYGGTWDLDNLDCDVCDQCNRMKGALHHDDYVKLRTCRQQLSPAGQSELDSILQNAGPGMQARWKAHADRAAKTKTPKNPPRAKQEEFLSKMW